MKKIFTTLAMAFAVMAMNAQETTKKTETLSIGAYDQLLKDGDNGANDHTYFDGIPNFAPTSFAFKYTGSQTIYTKEELAALADKEITAINHLFFNESGYVELKYTVNVFIQEITEDRFRKNPDTERYEYFDFNIDNPQATFAYQYDGYGTAYQQIEFPMELDKPFYYSGKKNLLVTVVFEASNENTNYPNYSDVRFFKIKDTGRHYQYRTMTFASDITTFNAFRQSNDWPKAYSSRNEHGVDVDQPVTKFTFQEKSITNGIDEHKITTRTATHQRYNLAGQKVSSQYKGVVIENGRKFINR